MTKDIAFKAIWLDKEVKPVKEWISKFKQIVLLVKNMPKELKVLQHACNVDKKLISED